MFKSLGFIGWPQFTSEIPSRVTIQQPNHEKNGQPPRASLLGIPGEMRNSIYKQLFPDIQKDITRLQVLLTCRQIYHEAAIQAFKLRRFVIQAEDKVLATRLSFLSQQQKDMIKIVERPESLAHALLTRHFFLAIEQHLHPSCLLLGMNEATHLLGAMVRIESLTHVFAHSRDGFSINRLSKWHLDMRKHDNCSAALFHASSDNIDFSEGTDTDCVLVGPLQSSSFVVRIVSGVQHRDVIVKVPRYSLSSDGWEYHMDGVSTWLPAR